MKQRGILLAVVSRNEEHDVRHVSERHPEMILHSADIAASKVNWRQKSENLLDLANELRLRLDSFVFVDDDRAVRLEVKSRTPAVHVVPLPPGHALWCETLGRLWLFESAVVTQEDASRTQLYNSAVSCI